MNDYIDELEAALIDMLDGQSSWYEIRDNTGLSEDRCKEIEELSYKVWERYSEKHELT